MAFWRRPQVWTSSSACGTLLAGLLFVCLCSAPNGLASGFRITNQSLGAVGKAGANTAYLPGPDASYYNPAAMAFLPDQWQVETSLTTLYLPSVQYSDAGNSLKNGTSESELFYMPLLHLVSPSYGRLRFGFSLTYPFGLAKQWPEPFPKIFAQKISLVTVEANPSLSLQLNDWLSLGAGVRFVHGRGEVDNEIINVDEPSLLSHSSNASDSELGYNLALHLRPNDRWNIAATYRSKIELELTGNGVMRYISGAGEANYIGSTALSVPLPAVFSLSTSYTFERLTIELAWDRTFWSSFTELDFTYAQAFTTPPFDFFDAAVPRNWKDTNAYRLGLTYEWNEQWTTILGIAYDETPVPDQSLEFELPDSDALVYCAGVRYRYSPSLELGLSYMYHQTQSRSVNNDLQLDGTFTDGGAHAITFGLITRF